TQPTAATVHVCRGESGDTRSSTYACASAKGRSDKSSADVLFADVAAEPLAELGAEVRGGQGQLHGGSQVVELAADVVTALVERVAEHVAVREQTADGVRELDLAARA